MKGTKIAIVFPEEVYNYLDKISKKMATVQAINPATGQPLVNPVNNAPVFMLQTGKVEEFIHIAIHSTIFPLVMQNPNFMTEAGQIKRIAEVYSQYMEKFIGSEANAKKAA